MDTGMIELFIHYKWLKVIKNLKGVKGAIHITKNGAPTPYKLQMTLVKDGIKSRLVYSLEGNKDLERIEAEYNFILADLQKKGYG